MFYLHIVAQVGTSFRVAFDFMRHIFTAPVLPAEKELLVFKNQTTVVLDLRAFQNGGCPITGMHGFVDLCYPVECVLGARFPVFCYCRGVLKM